MTEPRIGELFAGYGGLGLGVTAGLGGRVAWVSDVDKAANKVLAHRYPGAPNHGDITQIDWTNVEPVEVLTGGFPCQDVSAAGKRAGLRPDTRSGLWTHFAYAIDQLRPRIVVIENVRGLLSATAHSDVEPCPWCVGDNPGGALRALGAVLGDLAALGFDAEWIGLPASRVGACHGRWREFILAWPTPNPERGGRDGGSTWTRNASGDGATAPGGREGTLLPTPTTRDVKGPNQRGDASCLTGALLPTPRASDGIKGGPNQRGSSGDLMLPSAVALLPTPVVNDMGDGKSVEAWDNWTAKMKTAHGNGNGHGPSLAIEAQRLLPTPRASDGPQPTSHARTWSSTDHNLHNVAREQTWGDYTPAIERWEDITGRPAPPPTQQSSKGNPQLAPAFTEWMMGLPAGWITDVPGLSRNDMLRLCGNGVVPQQAGAALRELVSRADR